MFNLSYFRLLFVSSSSSVSVSKAITLSAIVEVKPARSNCMGFGAAAMLPPSVKPLASPVASLNIVIIDRQHPRLHCGRCLKEIASLTKDSPMRTAKTSNQRSFS